MIKETKGNLFEADTEAFVNAVNCVGVMGKGIALQFRQRFSEDYFKDYKAACKNGDLRIGKVHIYSLDSDSALAYARASDKNFPRFIVNFPTKDYWRDKSRIEYIESGLQSLVEEIELHKIKSIAMPALGCGLGGLDFQDVRFLVEKAFDSLTDVKVIIYTPWDSFRFIVDF